MSARDQIRTLARPLVHLARRLLTTPEPEKVFRPQTIVAGPARSCQLILPEPSVLSERIIQGQYEPVCTRVIEQLIGPEDVCFDIGGHYGYFTFSLAGLAPRGHVHTFEPVPEHADRLRKGVELSAVENVTIHQLALAQQPGEMELSFAGEGSDDSMAFLSEYGGVDTEAAQQHYQTFRRMTVTAESLDHLVVGTPRFIKIDCEGAEAEVLRGGQKLIADCRPRLLIEVHGIAEALRCSETLLSLDYVALLLSRRKETLPVLWVHREDREAMDAVARALGFSPTVVFGGDESLPAAGSA